MPVVAIVCASCGAPISVPDTVKFVTCAHCGSSLKVTASEGAIYSEIADALGAVKEATAKGANASERVANELELKRLQEELGALTQRTQRDRAAMEETRKTADARVRAMRSRVVVEASQRKRERISLLFLFAFGVLASPFVALFATGMLFTFGSLLLEANGHRGLEKFVCATFPIGLLLCGLPIFFVLRAIHRRAESLRPVDTRAAEAEIERGAAEACRAHEAALVATQQQEQAVRSRIEELRRLLQPSGRWAPIE